MKKGDTILQVNELTDSIGYELISDCPDRPVFRLHITKQTKKQMGKVPFTLVGAKISIFGLGPDGVLHAAFDRLDGKTVTWKMTDPEGLKFKTAFENGALVAT